MSNELHTDYDLLVDLPVGIFHTNLNGTCLFVNRRWQEISGIDAEAAVGLHWVDAVHPEDRIRVAMAWSTAATAADPFQLELRFLHPDGRVTWGLAKGKPRTDSAGSCIGYLGALTEISDRKELEVALQDSQARFRAVFHHTNKLGAIFSLEGRVLEATEAAIALVGAHSEEIIGRAAWDTAWASHSTELQDRLEVAVRQAASGKADRLRARHPRPDGSWATVDLSIRPVVDDAGNVVYLLADAFDISGFAITEASLAKSREQNRVILHTVLDAVLTLDQIGTVQSFNLAAEKIFGYSAAEVVGQHINILMPEPYRWELGGSLDRNREAGGDPLTGIGREVSARREDGTVFPIELSVSELWWHGKRGYTAVIRDITARRRSEEELRTRAEMLDRAQEIANIGSAVRLPPFGTGDQSWSAQAYRIHGLDPQDGPPSWEDYVQHIVASADRRRVAAEYERATAAEDRLDLEYRIILPDGTLRHVHHVSVPGLDANGVLTRWTTAFHDVSEERRTEEQYLQAQKMEAVGQLAGGIAHDFKNLLTGILGCSDILARSPPGADRDRGLQLIRSSAERGVEMVRGLLDIARQRDSELEAIDLGDTIRASERLLKRLAGDDVQLSLAVESAPLPVLADAGLVSQVLLNLVVNARQAMPDGGLLQIRAHRHDDQVEVLIADSGVGMDEDTMAHAFDAFFTTKGAGEGTGLGLASVHTIVKRLHGSVGVESERGVGSTFRLSFPLLSQFGAVDLGTAEAAAAGKETILLVDDEEVVRMTARFYLEQAGYRVLQAESPDEALAIARDQHVDVLVTDIVMPKQSGTELAAEMCALRPGVGTVFMSAFPTDVLIRDGRVPPGTESIEKPFTEAGLTSAVRAALR